ncbi:hypothetical protein VUR80DRAFT_1108 [Thermomyces stellatus]
MSLSVSSVARAAARTCARCHAKPRPAQALYSTSAAPTLPEAPKLSVLPHFRGASRPRWVSQTPRRASDQGAASSDRSGPAPQTYYDLFPESLAAGPPPNGPFAIDVRTLRREFLQLQSRAHPDLHASEDKTRAQSTSAYLNEAFRTLADPLMRAQYLLSLRGIDVAGDEEGKVTDMELLAEVMEAREQIEEAATEEELEGPKTVNDERIKGSVEALGRLFEADDLEGARKEAVRLRYWVNIKHCLDEWQPGKPVELHH